MYTSHNWFAYGAKIVLYVVAAMLPVWFLPQPFGIDFGREITFGVLIAIGAIAWLVSLLVSGEIRYPHSPILYAAAALIAALGISAILSGSPYISAFLADPAAERWVTLAAGLALMATVAGGLRSRGEAGTLLFVLIFAGAAAALSSALQFIADISIYRYLDISNGAGANVIGTANGLALFYASLLMMTMGLLLSPAAHAWKGWVRGALIAAAFFFFLDLLLVNFRTSWIVLLGSSVVLFGLLLIDRTYKTDKTNWSYRHWAALGLVILSIVMIMARGSVIRDLNLPAEVSPSLGATFSLAGSVFREGPLKVFFGSGPGTFGLDWARYKDASINQTIFWGVRFNQGQSWLATLLPTAGILGFIAVLGFLAMTLFVFLRAILEISKYRNGEISGPDGLATGAFLGFVPLLVSAFLYPANTSLLLLLFLLIGIAVYLLAARPTAAPETEAAGELSEAGLPPAPVWSRTPNRAANNGFWVIRERLVRFETPWAVFASSLAIIFFLAVGVVALYGQTSRVRAALAANRGVAALNAGNIDQAITHLEQAVRIEPRNYRNLQALTQVRTEKARQLIQKAAGGENVQQEFQSAVSLAIQSSQQLTQLHPQESALWRIQGSLYEMIIPFIQGSERFATAAYQQAAALEPLNPAIYVDWGRAGLVFTDRIMLVANQAQGKDKDQLIEARRQSLEQITPLFQRAIEVKPDFAPAHFLLAQTLIRLGNIDAAIESVENAKLAAPFDIGVAFQLGLLYYQKDNLARSQQEFERAVTINENYSNARYFLGLIYDRKGEKDKAIAEFERIAKLNPDNQEIGRIAANLKEGKPALDGIVPPAPPPEQRKDTPVKEQERSK